MAEVTVYYGAADTVVVEVVVVVLVDVDVLLLVVLEEDVDGVGAIVGWNIFTGSQTDMGSLVKIVSTWVVCPVLAAVFAAVFYLTARRIISRWPVHLLELDAMTRAGLIAAGAFGAYSLGANNIANVMGVFVPDNPFSDIEVLGVWTFTATQQLFFLGAAAIGAGVLAYSQRVMSTKPASAS